MFNKYLKIFKKENKLNKHSALLNLLFPIFDTMELLEIVGWIATTFIISSFLINDMIRLRAVNLIGALCWLIYGIMAIAPSIIFLNVVIIAIQIFKLWGLIKNKKN
ncbi:MAG: YgjV family protein [Flavobacteriaceae bacterium]|nr:YgjV family protein [Flavobacteriaceae bacterium]MDG2386544.1 YgjV family protein [Flavobacteriaceae bacterium]